MSLIEIDDDTPLPNPTLETKPYAGMANDTRLTPTTDLLTHIRGSKQIVTYYSQVLGPDNEPTPYSPSIPPALQPYIKIDGFELKVTTALSPVHNQELAEFEGEGTAYLFPHVIPNAGDAFVMPIAPGRLGLLTVKTADQKSIFKETTYEITYQIRSFLDADTERDLANKVTKSVFYIRDFLRIGRNPMLVDSEYETYQQIQKDQYLGIEAFYSEFYNTDYETFLVPDQTSSTYDPHVVDFLLGLVNKDHHPIYRNAESINCDDTHTDKLVTVWNALMEGDLGVLEYCVRKVAVVPTRYVYTHPLHRTIRYSGIATVVLPDTQYPEVKQPLSFTRTQNAQPTKLNQFITNTTLPGLTMRSATELAGASTPTLSKYAYVFSPEFYEGRAPLSELEGQVYKALTTGDVDIAVIGKLFKQVKRWTPLERFYFVPVLIYLSYFAVGALN